MLESQRFKIGGNVTVLSDLVETVQAAPEVDYPGMRKQRVFTTTPQGIRPHDEGWLDLDRAASVEVTSEEKDYNIRPQEERRVGV